MVDHVIPLGTAWYCTRCTWQVPQFPASFGPPNFQCSARRPGAGTTWHCGPHCVSPRSSDLVSYFSYQMWTCTKVVSKSSPILCCLLISKSSLSKAPSHPNWYKRHWTWCDVMSSCTMTIIRYRSIQYCACGGVENPRSNDGHLGPKQCQLGPNERNNNTVNNVKTNITFENIIRQPLFKTFQNVWFRVIFPQLSSR